MTLETPLVALKGVGPELAKKLAVLRLKTVADLIDYYPRRYDDYSQVTAISQLQPGTVTIKAVIKQATGRYVRRGMHITEAVASDDSGSVRLVWFNQPYRATAIKPNAEYYISGDFGLKGKRLNITSPSMELVSDFPVNTARIIPIYKETKGLKSAQLRKLLHQCLPVLQQLPETMPSWLIKEQQLISFAQALRALHFPASAEDLALARTRLGFEEVFRLTLAALLNKYELLQEVAIAIPFEQSLAQDFVGKLPFQLTDGQRKVTWQIYQDMQKTTPMNRLVEGDVGSGKTVVAVMAAVMALKHGFQVAYMAPTEILARQHYETITDVMRQQGLDHEVSLLVGSMPAAQKSQVHQQMAAGQTHFIVGTHALISENVDLHRLGLVIIDEQHRFGVEQRKALLAKAGHAPHVLSMTATPIPRSLALSLYGELDISVLDTMPAGRQPIITKICSPNSIKQLYSAIEVQLAAGRQAFVVCPLISESDAMPAKSAEQVHKELTVAFRGRQVGLLHGKLKPAEKDAVMQRFLDHTIDVLVSTTVIEVGVNVPNATVMVIQNAERFGLAQIHQLRGRVGRGSHQGYCYLLMGDSSAPSRRLRALEQSTDGFKLAELDLEIRGPGAIYGTMQHGQLDLRIAKLTDVHLIAAARKAAQSFIDRGENLLDYTELYQATQKLRAVTNLN